MGGTLFERQARGLALTSAGALLREALEQLQAGDEAVSRTQQDNVLTVTMFPNFTNKWLVPRLGAFAESHPEIGLQISAARHHVDSVTDGIDLGTRHGTVD